MAQKLKKLKKASAEFEKIVKKKKKKKKLDVKRLIPSGITPLDLECSGTTYGAFLTGKIVNIIGDSHSGKTLLYLTIVAECCYDPRFADYDFYLDDVENALEFDIEEMFGKGVKNRLTIMDGRGGRPEPSETIENFADTVNELMELGKPFLYGLDSFDALDSEADRKKEQEDRKKRKRAKEAGREADITGSYGDGKPKIFSRFCKQNKGKLKRSNSTIFVISQTRDNIGFGAMFNPKTRSGGKALKFYSLIELWLATQKDEKDQKSKSKRIKTTTVQAKLTKNKITGQKGVCFFPVLPYYGIDNLTACVTFLLEEKYWTGTKNSVNTKGFIDRKLSVKKLVKYIEKNNFEEELKEECQKAYNLAIDKMKPKDRKKKYH